MVFTTPPNSTSQLGLDPGPKPRRRAKLTCRHTLWTVFILVCLTATYFAFQLIRTVTRSLISPNHHLHQDLSAPYNPNDVVRPLIDSDQTFDIVATVWLKQDVPEANDTTVETDVDESLGAFKRRLKMDPIPPRLTEEPVFSDTVFRGLRLCDKIASTNVNLTIPTEVFRNAELWSYDLRASFVLVPNEPSPLMKAVNYSSWIPASAQMPPMRPPHASENRSLIDEIIDSYGIFVPLLEFHPIPTKCEGGRLDKSASEDDTEDDSNDNWDEPQTMTQAQFPQPSPLDPYRSTRFRSPTGAHPYVVTSTHIRVVDRTDIFNRRAYDREHLKLSEKSCGQWRSPTVGSLFAVQQPSWTSCMRDRVYGTNGNLETRIKLRTTDEDTGTKTTQWAYGPYMDYSFHASGPLDLTRVPVTREVCPNSKYPVTVEDKDTMNITWNIAFSGRTPAKLVTQSNMALALLAVHEGRNMSATEYDLHREQDKHIYINALFRHRLESGSHPRLYSVIYATAMFVFFFEFFLDIKYWYTRSTTAGISIPGTALLIAQTLVSHALDVASEVQSTQPGFFGWITAALFHVDIVLYMSTIWMLKTITRAELQWSSRIPRIRIAKATHAERASQRVETRTPWYATATAYAASAAVYFTFQHFELFVLISRGVSAPPMSRTDKTIGMLHALLTQPAHAVGMSLQLVLNFRAKKFAGAYKIKAYMACFTTGSLMVLMSPNIFGSLLVDDVLHLSTVVEFVLAAALAWQAKIYPHVKQEEVEE